MGGDSLVEVINSAVSEYFKDKKVFLLYVMFRDNKTAVINVYLSKEKVLQKIEELEELNANNPDKKEKEYNYLELSLII